MQSINGDVAAIDFMTGKVLEGHLPNKAMAMVQLGKETPDGNMKNTGVQGNSAVGMMEDCTMFYKIKNVAALPDFRLSVQFSEGVTKIYDVKPLFYKPPIFAALKDDVQTFYSVSVDVGGYRIVWSDESDLSCGELWEHRMQIHIHTPFDGFIAFSDATELWGLNGKHPPQSDLIRQAG